MSEITSRGPLVRVCELFAGLPRLAYKNILSNASRSEFEAGQAIFWAGDRITEILLLTHGHAKVTLPDCNGNEVILRLVVPGEIVGALILEKGEVYSSTAQALEPCRVLAWDSVTFEAASEGFPALRHNAMRILVRRLRELESRFFEISTETVSPRLARALVRLIDQLGHRINGDHEINLTQQALAQMTAMTMFTVNRVLSDWEKEGFVSLRRNAIVIRDYDRLRGIYSVN